jgi:alkylhydroperoxidase family enzyme
MKAVLADYRTAPIDEKLRATLGFLEKLTLTPVALGPDDVRALLALGLSRDHVREAVWVAAIFNMYPRLADTLGWHVPSRAGMDAGAKILLTRGYK